LATRDGLPFLTQQHAGIRPSARQTLDGQILPRLRLSMQICHRQRFGGPHQIGPGFRFDVDLPGPLDEHNLIFQCGIFEMAGSILLFQINILNSKS
jgi:hypothetical protein